MNNDHTYSPVEFSIIYKINQDDLLISLLKQAECEVDFRVCERIIYNKYIAPDYASLDYYKKLWCTGSKDILRTIMKYYVEMYFPNDYNKVFIYT